jgi:hypothetical protein
MVTAGIGKIISQLMPAKNLIDRTLATGNI